MAVYKIFPIKDASLYEQYPNTNTGLDAILEVSNYQYLGSPYYTRTLIQFSTNEMNDVINNRINGADFKTYLKLYSAINVGLPQDFEIYIHPVSGSWQIGTGEYKDSAGSVNGVSWNWKTNSGSGQWENEGGDYYATPVQSQSFEPYNSLDIITDVSETVLEWYSGSKDNHGFLLKMTSSLEGDINQNTINRYFSVDTNTIYPPCLEVRWDDYVFNTGSNSVINTPQAFVSIYNNKTIYYQNDIARFRIAATPKYPTRTFQTSSLYSTNYYLPQTSLYAIKDVNTNEYIIDFDSNYTKISADSESSYFDIYMNGLEPERYYKLVIKTIIGGETKEWEDNLIFKLKN